MTLSWQKFLVVGLATMVFHFALGTGFLIAKRGGADQLIEQKNRLTEKWSEEDREREAKQEEELVAHYGTTKLDRIAFDPRLDIRLVIQKLLEATLSPEYIIEVKADRFMEFNVFVNVYNMPETDVLIKATKEVLSRVNPRYVDEIIFSDGDRFWIMDNGQIRKVGDWDRASGQVIRRYCFTH